MKWYSLQNSSRWGINELQYFKNPITKKTFKIDTNWKGGTLDVLLEDNTNIEDVDTDTTVDIYRIFDEVYVNSFTSGTDEFSLYDSADNSVVVLDDEHELSIGYYEHGVNFLYDMGYTDEEDSEIIFTGGFTLEETVCPYEL